MSFKFLYTQEANNKKKYFEYLHYLMFSIIFNAV